MNAEQDAQLQLMAASMQQQQLMNVQLQQELIAQRALLAQMQHVPAPARVFMPRIPNAPAYTGNPSESLDDWIGSMEQQVLFYALDDARGMSFIISFFQSGARDWYAELRPIPVTWAELKAELRKRYQPITTEETARAKLYSLSQGSMSVSDLVSTFRRLAQKLPNMHESDQLFQFMRALKPSIAAQIRVAGVVDLKAATEMAIRLGASPYQSASHHSGGGGGGAAAMDLNHVESQRGSSSSSSAAPGVDLQDVEVLHAIREHRTSKAQQLKTGRRFQSHLTPEQVVAYRAAGKCFGCGATDHESPRCPRRRVDGKTGVVSWPSSSN